MASAPIPGASWLQRHQFCYRALLVVLAIATMPVLIVWIIAGAREERR